MLPRPSTRPAGWLILIGVLNAALYSSLLPLWEGFDEPFHYACVQTFSAGDRLPVLGREQLSDEVWLSMTLAPASHVVRRSYPALSTFSEYFALGASERAALRRRVQKLSPELRSHIADGPPNYEAHQAPLAYALLALPDRWWAEKPIGARILRLRLAAAIAAIVLLSIAAWQLASQLGLSGPFRSLALFLILSTQMLYASVAHIANDWLALPLAAFVLSAAVALYRTPGARTTAALALALALGLLTKAYFLAFVPLGTGLVLWFALRRKVRWRTAAVFAAILLMIAGPWYARNVTLYGSLSAMHESVHGVAAHDAVAALIDLDWAGLAPAMLRASLWTGNNSFTSFSAVTLNLMLLVLLAGMVMLGLRLKGPDLVVAAGCALFGLGIVFVTGVSTVYRGHGVPASPWYAAALLTPAIVLATAGMARGARAGRWLAGFAAILWTYVISATYVAKLIPLYGGYEQGKTTLKALVQWYATGQGRAREILAVTALGSPEAILSLVVVVIASSAVVCFVLVRQIRGMGRSPEPQVVGPAGPGDPARSRGTALRPVSALPFPTPNRRGRRGLATGARRRRRDPHPGPAEPACPPSRLSLPGDW
jgi:4-amino-4-deoxy-L-arabinose transferase-like glycosyltransferase